MVLADTLFVSLKPHQPRRPAGTPRQKIGTAPRHPMSAVLRRQTTTGNRGRRRDRPASRGQRRYA